MHPRMSDGELMCSSDGKNFKELGVVKNIMEIANGEATNNLANGLNNVAKAFCELTVSMNISSKEMNELRKLLGLKRRVFRKIRKGNKIRRVVWSS